MCLHTLPNRSNQKQQSGLIHLIIHNVSKNDFATNAILCKVENKRSIPTFSHRCLCYHRWLLMRKYGMTWYLLYNDVCIINKYVILTFLYWKGSVMLSATIQKCKNLPYNTPRCKEQPLLQKTHSLPFGYSL